MKKISVLMMVLFAILFTTGCTKTNVSNDKNISDTVNIKQQIAERNAGKNEKKEKSVDEKGEGKDEKKDEKGEKENPIQDQAKQGGDVNKLATCLTEKGFKMYGTLRCGHCKKQKALFGSSFESIDFVNCDEEKEVCLKAGIEGYPTWKTSEGKLYPGSQPLEKLATLSQCAW